DEGCRGPGTREHHRDVALRERVAEVGLLPGGGTCGGEAVLGGEIRVELDALLRFCTVELAGPLAAVLRGDLAARAPDPGVDLELGVTGNGEGHHLGVRGLDGLAGGDDVVPRLG